MGCASSQVLEASEMKNEKELVERCKYSNSSSQTISKDSTVSIDTQSIINKHSISHVSVGVNTVDVSTETDSAMYVPYKSSYSDDEYDYGYNQIDTSTYDLEEMCNSLPNVSIPFSQSQELAACVINIYSKVMPRNINEEELVLDEFVRCANDWNVEHGKTCSKHKRINKLACMGCLLQTNEKMKKVSVVDVNDMVLMYDGKYVQICFSGNEHISKQIPKNENVLKITFNPKRFQNKLAMAINFSRFVLSSVDGIEKVEMIKS